MAIVLGTNAGFVTVAPTADPGGSFGNVIDESSYALKVVSPVGSIKITEIGWYSRRDSNAAVIQVGLYSHNVGDNNPETRLYSSGNFDKGTTEGWKVKTGINFAITGETIYWIALQCDNTITSTQIDSLGGAGEKNDEKSSSTFLSNPWGASTSTADSLGAIYAVVEIEEPVGFTRKIKIGGTFVDKPIKEKKAGTFVDKPIKIKVGGTFQDA